MPVQSCEKDGEPGFKWGESGTCYTYDPNAKGAKERARAKAALQGQAVKVAQARKQSA